MNAARSGLEGAEVHLRSVFLQGLLLLPPDAAVAHVPRQSGRLRPGHSGATSCGLDPVRGAIGVAKSLPGVRYCVVGVDRQSQLEEIIEAWASTGPIEAAFLATTDEDVIDPRRWARKQ